MTSFAHKAARLRNAVHHPLHRYTLLELHEGDFASLIADLKARESDIRAWLAGRYAFEECAANYASDDELRDGLRETRSAAEWVFTPFLDSLMEEGCTFDKAHALQWALHHAGCTENPSNR